ncbi:calcineurin-like phosphoesterase C-terminal domain-containing protein [Sphingobacterium litopenaei]|uniref:Calcineurin-like phosphoesterase C-terminal domain-containing protein n=1 Tax=Sphingobacterium litopenaei TaxID=2763500 RepID=A0ABR7YC23_9SPHI|nr:calcineurin-like phosphoesterase family protein [Sphingobacterium litopenaei]MBD1428846.1 calcineurin-like phosphoesterase C-terminal domain-containing protein [Sphingobacterium litopenaei]
MKNKLIKYAFWGSLFLCSFEASAQQFAKGIVFEDSNRNGKRDKKEKVLPNVAVSNGREVVQTNSKGEYKLPVGEDNILFVVKPSGYMTPVNENNLPQFYYIHNPKGAPKLKYKGVDPTGPLPKSVDFPLYPIEEKEEYKIIVFGDPQVYNMTEVDYLKRGVVEELKGVKGYEFGISLGDLVGNDPNLFDPYINVMKDIGLPWYQVMGNHDENYDVPSDSLADVSFKAHFGPNNYSFNKGKVHFLFLDDVLYQGQDAAKKYIGGLREDQLEFIENDLKYVPKDYLVVICAHIPLVNNGKHAIREEDNLRLFKVLKDFPYTFSMSAHTHYQKQIFIDKTLGWQQEQPHHHYNVGTTSGSWYTGELDEKGVPPTTMVDGTKKGYAVVTFKGNKYELDYHVSNAPKDERMGIFLPKVTEKKKNSKASMYVNYYLGGEKDTIDYRVDGGKWVLMKRTETYDPHLLLEVLKWDTSETLLKGLRPNDPNLSTHIWKAAVPSDVAVGKHTIEFRVRDMFGRTFTTSREYQVAKN